MRLPTTALWIVCSFIAATSYADYKSIPLTKFSEGCLNTIDLLVKLHMDGGRFKNTLHVWDIPININAKNLDQNRYLNEGRVEEVVVKEYVEFKNFASLPPILKLEAENELMSFAEISNCTEDSIRLEIKVDKREPEYYEVKSHITDKIVFEIKVVANNGDSGELAITERLENFQLVSTRHDPRILGYPAALVQISRRLTWNKEEVKTVELPTSSIELIKKGARSASFDTAIVERLKGLPQGSCIKRQDQEAKCDPLKDYFSFVVY
jgi:hypothetical protein